MSEITLLGSWVRRFLLEHLAAERGLARNTQRSYRDTLTLLLPFVTAKLKKPVDRLNVTDISGDVVRLFLTDLETSRQCGIATRNQRLAAIHSLAHFIGDHSPEHIDWCSQVRAIPFKKTQTVLIPYLEKPEMAALLASPNGQTAQGRRDHALLLFLYNSGTRASEAAQLRIGDLDVATASVTINGKGGKQRRCPLWSATLRELLAIINTRPPEQHVFLNRRNHPITRFGIHDLVQRYALKAAQTQAPSLATKRVSPHTIRHTAATHLLRAGVDINTIRAWLGHVSLNTTNVYAEIDLEMKAKALAKCSITGEGKTNQHWRDDPALMAFLRSI
jgi:site-specific recombinase XerD